MHPPLTLHRHPMCADIIEQFQKCHADHPIAKFFGKCTDLKLQLDRCFRQEKAMKRKANFEESKRFKEKLRASRKAMTEEAQGEKKAGKKVVIDGGHGFQLGHISEGGFRIFCRRKEKNRDEHPYKVIEITPPPKNLGIRCFPSNMQCGESVTIEGQAYTISAVIHRYQLRKGRYEPSEKRLDVQSTGRYILNLYLENLLEQS